MNVSNFLKSVKSSGRCELKPQYHCAPVRMAEIFYKVTPPNASEVAEKRDHS